MMKLPDDSSYADVRALVRGFSPVLKSFGCTCPSWTQQSISVIREFRVTLLCQIFADLGTEAQAALPASRGWDLPHPSSHQAAESCQPHQSSSWSWCLLSHPNVPVKLNKTCKLSQNPWQCRFMNLGWEADLVLPKLIRILPLAMQELLSFWFLRICARESSRESSLTPRLIQKRSKIFPLAEIYSLRLL